MRIRVSSALVLAALLVLPALAFAQAKPATTQPAAIQVSLDYYEDNSGTFEIRDEQGSAVDPLPQFGDAMKVGWTIVTGTGDLAELKMVHTGTIIKVGGNTNFKLDQLRTATEGQDVFSLAVGKIRTVAGKASGKDQYQIKTQSAVCGVRGSDAVVSADDFIAVFKGHGWMVTDAGVSIDDIPEGFSVAALVSTVAQAITQELKDEFNNNFGFAKEDVASTEAAHQAYLDELAAGATGGETTTTTPPTPPTPQTNPVIDSIMKKLREILGMEIGSITIGGETWSKVVVQPTFGLGPVKTALYLPIIYNGDMFNPDDWYKPAGNNEWSFGTDYNFQTDPLGMVGDIASDLFLKIKYFEWGQQRDPFFFKVGNLNDITIGHGLIMRNFANDADFPAVRRVGVNLGLDFGGFGFEAMVNDAAAPDIVGGRLYIRPVPNFKAALGVSTLVDLHPAKDWPGTTAGTVDPLLVGDPIFINPGIDLDLPFVEGDFFSLVAFADGAVMLPYLRSVPTDPAYGGLQAGFRTEAIVDQSASLPFKNWGVAAGLFGNLIIRDFTWRLEFRDYTGAFVPQFYNSGYERTRSIQVQNVLTYLNDPASADYNTPTMGIFGEGGLTLPKLFSLKLSYFWPWAQDAAGDFTFDNDQLVALFTLEKGVIPVVDLSGTISYQRTDFMPTIINGEALKLSLFDANTVVSVTINYPVSANLDVTFVYTTTAKRNAAGQIIPDPNSPGGLLPQLDTSLAIQTSVHP